MNVEPWLMFLGAVITVTGSYGAAKYASKATVRTKELDVDAAAYERADRINAAAFQRLEAEVNRQGAELSRLRTTVEKLTKAFQVAVTLIEQFLSGSRPQVPEPLKEYLDPRLIEEYARRLVNEETR